MLLVAALATVVSGLFASRLLVNADLRALMPGDSPVVVSLERIEDSFGSTNSVNFLAKGGTLQARHAFTDALETELVGHPLLRDVEHGIEADFFSERALYYLSEAEMEQLSEHIEAWNQFEVCSRAPENCFTEPDKEAPKRLRKFVKDKRDRAYRLTGFRDRYEREDVDAEVMLAYPNEPASRLEAADAITTAMRDIAREVYEREDQPWSDSGMTYNVLGSYITKADERRTVMRDMVVSGIFAVVGVVFVLYVLFRSNRAVLVLLIPLTCGVVWSLGATQISLGRLNAMTATISTVVMGVGIDAGIHFYSRAKRYRQEHDDAEAITLAFRGLVVPLLIASSTTVGAFGSMASSDFPAFHEFGIIAALGVALCLLSMVTVLPALAYLVGIKKRVPKTTRNEGVFARLVMARPGLLFVLLLGVTIVAGAGARDVGFEYNVRELQSAAGRVNSEADAALIAEVFGKDIHAAVLTLGSVEEVRTTLATARERHSARVAADDSLVADFLGVTDLLPDPAIDQTERSEEVEDLRLDYEDLLEKLRKRAKEPKAEDADFGPEDVEMLDTMLAAKPFGVDELPRSLLAKVRADDGTWAVYAYPGFDAADMRQGLRFKEELNGYLDNPDESIFVGEAVLYAAMFLALREEAPIVLGMAALIIAGLVLWQLRSLRWMLMTLLPLAVSLLWLAATMGAIDLRFTLFNLPILPAILGIGVDNGVYLTTAIRRQARTVEGLTKALDETGGAIMAATATTAVGFAAFMVADSGGVQGIGSVAVVGILMAAAAALLVLPTLTSVTRGRGE